MAKGAKSISAKKNKLGVKNSLVNNINAKKKEGTSHTKNNSTISEKNYEAMEEGWDKKEIPIKRKPIIDPNNYMCNGRNVFLPAF